MSFKYKFANAIAGFVRFVLVKILRRPAGFFPGKVATKLYPNILEEYASKFDGEVVLITGTNGKTSVTAVISQILKNERYDVVTNSTGANMETGVVSACLAHKFNPRTKTFGVFEVDELWVEKIITKIKPTFLVLLNLFPDQADRYGSIENIQKSLHSALNNNSSTVFVYNADDPNSQIIAQYCNNQTISFGCHEKISDGDIDGLPNTLCPKCESQLMYLTDQYAQLGNYKCNNCGFKRAPLWFGASQINLTNDGYTWTIGKTKFQTHNTAEYFVYNYTAAAGMADILGCKTQNIVDTIANFKNDNGRMQKFNIDGKTVTINLAKNPAGFNQNIKYIWAQENKEPFTVAYFVNKKEGDGRSANWVNDVSFGALTKFSPQTLIGGEATKELSDIMRHFNIVAHRVDTARDVLAESKTETIYIIANYTAMFPLLDELKDIDKEKKIN